MIDGTHHKVDLTAPDKIIVIDVYQVSVNIAFALRMLQC